MKELNPHLNEKLLKMKTLGEVVKENKGIIKEIVELIKIGQLLRGETPQLSD